MQNGIGNLFDRIPRHLSDEEFLSVVDSPGLRIERIVSHGHSSPEGFWYDQTWSEWILVLQGAARLELDNPPRQIDLRPGDQLTIPAGLRHRVAWTDPDQPTVWLAVHWDLPPGALNPEINRSSEF